MKHIKRLPAMLLAGVMALACWPMMALADDVIEGDMGVEDSTFGVITQGSCGVDAKWTLYDDGMLYVYGSGMMEDYTNHYVPWSSYKDFITTVVIGKGITQIGPYAFEGLANLASVTIPDSVTIIDAGAFQNCPSLTTIDIPDDVTTIGSGAFYGCTGLTVFTIPEKVTTIGQNAFGGCTSLTAITIPNGVTELAQGIFQNCTGLQEIDLPNALTAIGKNAFYGCTGLQELDLPDSLTTIGESAFSGCTGLTTISVPAGVTVMEDYVFYGCTGLTTVNIPSGITTLEDGMFKNCTNLTTVSLPDGMTTLNDYAFNGCTGLGEIDLPDSLTTIGWNTFEGCTGLTSVLFPKNVTDIGAYAFRDCTGLQELTFESESCPSVNAGAFVNTALGTVYVPAAGYDEYVALLTGDLPEGAEIKVISGSEFDINGGILYNYYGPGGEVIVPDGVTEINTAAFRDAAVTKITLPDSLTTIGDSAFEGCSGLTEMTFTGTTVPEVMFDLFYDMTALETVYVPEAAYDDYESAFAGILPEGVALVVFDPTAPRCTITEEKAVVSGVVLTDYAEQNAKLMMAVYDGDDGFLGMTELVNGSGEMIIEAEGIELVQLFVMDSSYVPMKAPYSFEK